MDPDVPGLPASDYDVIPGKEPRSTEADGALSSPENRAARGRAGEFDRPRGSSSGPRDGSKRPSTRGRVDVDGMGIGELDGVADEHTGATSRRGEGRGGSAGGGLQDELCGGHTSTSRRGGGGAAQGKGNNAKGNYGGRGGASGGPARYQSGRSAKSKLEHLEGVMRFGLDSSEDEEPEAFSIAQLMRDREHAENAEREKRRILLLQYSKLPQEKKNDSPRSDESNPMVDLQRSEAHKKLLDTIGTSYTIVSGMQAQQKRLSDRNQVVLYVDEDHDVHLPADQRHSVSQASEASRQGEKQKKRRPKKEGEAIAMEELSIDSASERGGEEDVEKLRSYGEDFSSPSVQIYADQVDEEWDEDYACAAPAGARNYRNEGADDADENEGVAFDARKKSIRGVEDDLVPEDSAGVPYINAALSLPKMTPRPRVVAQDDADARMDIWEAGNEAGSGKMPRVEVSSNSLETEKNGPTTTVAEKKRKSEVGKLLRVARKHRQSGHFPATLEAEAAATTSGGGNNKPQAQLQRLPSVTAFTNGIVSPPPSPSSTSRREAGPLLSSPSPPPFSRATKNMQGTAPTSAATSTLSRLPASTSKARSGKGASASFPSPFSSNKVATPPPVRNSGIAERMEERRQRKAAVDPRKKEQDALDGRGRAEEASSLGDLMLHAADQFLGALTTPVDDGDYTTSNYSPTGKNTGRDREDLHRGSAGNRNGSRKSLSHSHHLRRLSSAPREDAFEKTQR
ncbi:unnamed protein product [Amoebophrya sp. A25]|nr:unnamed protein product [Amoebophrya sp. A25]|eukprot:GSA25T00007407001.1